MDKLFKYALVEEQGQTKSNAGLRWAGKKGYLFWGICPRPIGRSNVILTGFNKSETLSGRSRSKTFQEFASKEMYFVFFLNLVGTNTHVVELITT